MTGGTAPINTAFSLSAAAVTRDIARDFSAARGVADVNGVLQIEMLGKGCDIGGIRIHIMAVVGLARAAMTPAIVRDTRKPLTRK